MGAKYILVLVSVIFFIAAVWRTRSAAGRPHPQTRTWLLIAVIFAAVSGWLFARD